MLKKTIEAQLDNAVESLDEIDMIIDVYGDEDTELIQLIKAEINGYRRLDTNIISKAKKEKSK